MSLAYRFFRNFASSPSARRRAPSTRRPAARRTLRIEGQEDRKVLSSMVLVEPLGADAAPTEIGSPAIGEFALLGLGTDARNAQKVDAICGGNGNDSFSPPVLRGLFSDTLGVQQADRAEPLASDDLWLASPTTDGSSAPTDAAILAITGDGDDDTFAGRPVLQGLFSDTLGIAPEGASNAHAGNGFMADTTDEVRPGAGFMADTADE